MEQNKSKKILLDLGLVKESNIVTLTDQVRDRIDVGVLMDKETGVIFLNRTDHIDIEHYSEISDASYWGVSSREEALKKYAEDDLRRFQMFQQQLTGLDVVDVGCGTGGFMDYAKTVTKKIVGVEPQIYVQDELKKLGSEMYSFTENLPEQSFNVATLFHTLEHLIQPLKVLTEIRKSLLPGSTLIVEVPHARDVLLALESFKKFTFWSEHLILHTKTSLSKFLEEAGFVDVEVFGYQRYPVSNHLHWLAKNKPGGQNFYPNFDFVNNDYVDLLIESDKTDTLIAIAKT